MLKRYHQSIKHKAA